MDQGQKNNGIASNIQGFLFENGEKGGGGRATSASGFLLGEMEGEERA